MRSVQPTVAIESTIFAHGLPHPVNWRTATAMQRAVCDQQAEPAVIALIEGVVRVGLTEQELRRLCEQGAGWAKASVADLPVVAARRLNAATTVAATAHLAARRGIAVVVTGGIGGVHRDYGRRLDVSADLTALARTSVLLICSGIKCVLDVAATLEALEALGVTVVGYRTNELPGFYTASTGLRLGCQVQEPQELIEIWWSRQQLGLNGAIVVVQPPPPEVALERDTLEAWVEQAVREADRQHIAGKALTPYLLRRLAELSDGKTLTVNQALAVANAHLGGCVARLLAEACCS